MTYLDRELDYWLRNASGIRGTRSKAHRGEKRGRGGGKVEGKVARVWSLTMELVAIGELNCRQDWSPFPLDTTI